MDRPDGSIVELDLGRGAWLSSINNAGVIVGNSNRRAVVVRDDKPFTLPLPKEFFYSEAFSISDKNFIGGDVSKDGYFTQPAIWDKNGNVKKYPNIGTGYFGTIRGVNNRGYGVGYSYVNGNNHAVLAHPSASTLKDLGTLPGGHWADAHAINDSLVTVGVSDDRDGNHKAFFRENGHMYRLPLSVGMTQSAAYGINNAGVIVGAQWNNSGIYACMWVPVAP